MHQHLLWLHVKQRHQGVDIFYPRRQLCGIYFTKNFQYLSGDNFIDNSAITNKKGHKFY